MRHEDRPTPEEDPDDLEIETDGYFEAPLEERLDPRRDQGLAVVSIGNPRGEPIVFIHAEAMDQIVEHVGGETRNEVGGVLLGGFHLSRGKRVTVVQEALPAPGTRAGVSHVTFSHETWSAIFDRADLKEGQSIVGWYHSHPGFGVFLSKQDEFIQQYFFDNPGHVALVIDPVRHRTGVFGWHEGSVVPQDGFFVVAPREERARAVKYGKMLSYRVAREGGGPGGWLGRLLGRPDL